MTAVHKALLDWNFLRYHFACLVILPAHLDVQDSCKVQTHRVYDLRLTTPESLRGDTRHSRNVLGDLGWSKLPYHSHKRFCHGNVSREMSGYSLTIGEGLSGYCLTGGGVNIFPVYGKKYLDGVMEEL